MISIFYKNGLNIETKFEESVSFLIELYKEAKDEVIKIEELLLEVSLKNKDLSEEIKKIG